MELVEKAAELLERFKGKDYSFGFDKLGSVACYAGEFGERVLLIGNRRHLADLFEHIDRDFAARGIGTCGGLTVPGAGQNAPKEDVYRIAAYIFQHRPDCLVAVGGGSTIDAVKGANVLYSLGSCSLEIDDYFGSGIVTKRLAKAGRKLLPMVAVQTNASSGAHLTKYSNVTDPVTGQKKLIVDEAVVPDRAVFDYGVTKSVPVSVALDGAMDGISHCLEVFFGAAKDNLRVVGEIALTGIELILEAAPKLLKEPNDKEARKMLCLGTDLGGYAIMVGGTNGAHLTSFSLVDVTSHGRACGLMNPYYTVLFAPAIAEQLLAVGSILKRQGYIEGNLDGLGNRELGEKVAGGLMDFSRSIGFPTKLTELDGFSDEHIKRALAAAKDPQLRMKLENMPVPLGPEQIDTYMGSVLEAAKEGNLGIVRNLPLK